MTEFFVRRAGAVGGNTTAQIWHDNAGDPRQSMEHRQAIRLCIPLTDEIKHKYEQYLEQRTSKDPSAADSSAEHFPLSFFEWLQREYPEPSEESDNAKLPGQETKLSE